MKGRLIIGLALTALAAALPAPAAPRGIELTLFGGWGSSRFSGSSSYVAEWSYLELQSLRADTAITAASKSALSLGASLAWFPTANFGLEVMGASFDPSVATSAAFRFDYQLSGQAPVSESRTWPATGHLTTVPLSLDLVGRFDAGPVTLSASAGPTLFLNRFDALSFGGLGASFVQFWWVWIDQYADSFEVPLSISQTSWSAVGGNAGLSVDVRIGGPVSLTLDGRYYFCPSKDFAWHWQAGTYTGLDNPKGYFSDWEFMDSDLADAQAATTALRVNPSFYSVTAGIRIRL